MITRLLRRLQGHPSRASVDEPAACALAGPDPDTDTNADTDAAADLAPSQLSPGLDAAGIEHRFLALVLGVDTFETDADDARIETALHHLRMVAERFDVKRMPRLPALVPQLLASMRRDDNDAAQMATLLARDPTLAGEVIRVANSTFYRRSAAITSLQQAVHTLGHEDLRHVVLTSVMRPILRAHPSQPGYSSAEWLWKQSEACTFLCSRLAPGRCDPGEAQLAGVVAGTGASALLRMAALPMLTPAGAMVGFAPGFMLVARRLTARAAAHWQLMPEVRSALEDLPGPNGTDSALAQVMRASQVLSMASVLADSGNISRDAAADVECGLSLTRSQRLDLLSALQREREATSDTA